MSFVLILLHIVVCIALIMIVLLQTGKGADMGAAFGGGASQTLFGSTGASTFLSKATTAAAIVFMLTSLGLAYLSTQKREGSIIKDTKAPVEQKTTQTAPAETHSSDSATPPPSASDTAAPSHSEAVTSPDSQTTKPADSETSTPSDSGTSTPSDSETTKPAKPDQPE